MRTLPKRHDEHHMHTAVDDGAAMAHSQRPSNTTAVSSTLQLAQGLDRVEENVEEVPALS